MRYIKDFSKLFESHDFDLIFDWIKSEYPNCIVTKVSNGDKIKIKIECSTPIDGEDFQSKCYADIDIIVSDYADDRDYKVDIKGKSGEYGYDKSDKETWRKSKSISASRNELSFIGVKNLIKSTLDPHLC